MRRPLIFAILAGFAAILAAVIVFSALKRREAEVQKALANTVDIVVASHDLPLGSRIDPGAVKLARWSRDSVPEGAFTDPQALVNSFVKYQIIANEPVVASKLFMGEKTSGVLPLLIPNGMRAMSVPVDEVSDIAGFVQPRARVDVLVSVSGSGRDIPSFSKVVLQDIEVLAVAQEIEKKNDQPEVVKVVTLLVTPAQAEKLALATHEGQLHLAMRNYSDSKIVMTNGAEMRDLHGFDPPTIHDQVAALGTVRPPRVARPTLSVQIMRDGKSAESVSFIRSALSTDRMSLLREVYPAATAEPVPATAASSRGSSASSLPLRPQASASIMVPPILAEALRTPAGNSAPNKRAADAIAPSEDSPRTSIGSGVYVPAPKTIAIP